MNKFAFEVLDLINRIGLDNACWGVCDGFNNHSFDTAEPSIDHEGKFVYVWQDMKNPEFTEVMEERFFKEKYLEIAIYNDDLTLSGIYYFFKLD